MKYPHTIEIEIETKKGQKQLTTWAIYQHRPYPRIKLQHYRHWESHEGLFPEYGNNAKGLAQNYTATLLRSDYDEDTAQGNRVDYAGYKENHDSEPNQGTIVLRGEDLGETSILIEVNKYAHMEGTYASAQVRGSKDPTDGEKNFLDAQIVPALEKYIKKHKKQMHRETVKELKAYMLNACREAKEEIKKCEAEAREMLKGL